MFGSGTLSALGLLLVVAGLARDAPLFLLSLALLTAAGLSRLWERRCLEGVEYRRRFSRRQVGFGEEIQVEIEVVNRKLLPLSWLEIQDEIPRDLAPQRGRVHASHKPERALLASLLALRPYERVRRRYTLPCLSRGEHLFGPVQISSGDLFGSVSCDRSLDLIDSVVVYPRVLSLGDLGLPARNPLGDLRARSWIFEDAGRTAGARDYRPGDSLRRIHWPASVRAQRLQSRVYEATTAHSLALFVNVNTNEDPRWDYGYDPDVLEMTITTAASVAAWALDRGYQVGLYTNGIHRWSRHPVAVRPGRDGGQLERIFVALGRLQPVAAQRFEELLQRESRDLPYGATVLPISAALGEAAAAQLLRLRSGGHPLSGLLTGRLGVGASFPKIPMRRLGPPERWREGRALFLEGRPTAAGLGARAGGQEEAR